MTRARAGRILRMDSAWDLVAGFFLLLAPFEWFSDVLDLPGPLTTPVSAILGAITLLFSVLLWRASSATGGFAMGVNAAACWGNAAVVVVLLIVLIFFAGELSPVSGIILAAAMAVCALFAFLEDRIARSEVLAASPAPFLR